MWGKPSNIREFVWKIIDTDISIKKDLARGIVNVRSLANYIINTYKVNLSLDSVISAIRRYPAGTEKKRDAGAVYNLLKQANIRTVTKMASISMKKNVETTLRLSEVLPKVNYEVGEVLRILEGAKLFKIIIDKKSFDKMYAIFGKENILEYDKNICMIEMTFPGILKTTPGVFSAVATELGANDISIIDVLSLSNEHILIVAEKDLLKAFEILYNLCN
jgi:aspartokinase